MRATRWMQATNAFLLILQTVILVRLFTVHPAGENGFDGAVRVAGQTLVGFLISAVGLTFAVVTRKALKMQRWFALIGLVTTLGWGLLFLLASVAV